MPIYITLIKLLYIWIRILVCHLIEDIYHIDKYNYTGAPQTSIFLNFSTAYRLKQKKFFQKRKIRFLPEDLLIGDFARAGDLSTLYVRS